MPAELTQADLNMSCGSETWVRHWFNRNIILSEGVQHIMDKGLAWLIDAIASHETMTAPLKAKCQKDEGFGYLHFWTLDVDLDMKEAVLTCRADTGKPVIVEQKIPWTSCPLKEVKIYAGNDGPGTLRKLYMPSEY